MAAGRGREQTMSEKEAPVAMDQSLPEIFPSSLNEELHSSDPPLLIDVRESEEVAQLRINSAIHVPLDRLLERIGEIAPKKEQSLVLYCGTGVRSLYGVQTLKEQGYAQAQSLAGGITAWHAMRFPVERDSRFSPQQQERYSRHLTLPGMGEAGQEALLQSSVLLIGAGGLGSAAATYLAAAGVGVLGIVDDQTVARSNLQRQILHREQAIGMPKVESAQETLHALNSDVTVNIFPTRITADTVQSLIEEQSPDLIIDGSDNFPTKYLLNNVSLNTDTALIHGSVFRFEGQVTTILPEEGPCYRCLFPEPPPRHLMPD